jgi:predicted naringenin-chalcone synthase
MSEVPVIRSIGTAVPERSLSAARSLEVARALTPEQVPVSLLRRLHERSGIDGRGCAVLAGDGSVPIYGVDQSRVAVATNPGTADRMRAYLEAAEELAISASRRALAHAQVDAAGITHLVTASCTGFASPGIDQAIIAALGLGAHVRRTHIGFMGCHAAVNAMAVASAFAASDRAACVLLACAEVCTVHFQASARVDRVVANTLFADGAAAAVISAPPQDDGGVQSLIERPALARCASAIIPDSTGSMAWHIGDHGFEMTLGADVPDRIAAALPRWVDRELEALGMARADVGGWAIHPGGPRVIDAVTASLGLPACAGDASRTVLRRHGNMSSATLLFIMEEMRRAGVPRPWVGLAFGPGLAGEMAILT